MIIPKEQLKAENVRQIVENILKDHLSIGGDGYKCSQEQVSLVLIKGRSKAKPSKAPAPTWGWRWTVTRSGYT